MNLELVSRASAHGARPAIVDAQGTFTYQDLLARSIGVAGALRAMRELGTPHDGLPPRVAYLASPGVDYVAVQWGVWLAGAIGVPLSAAQAPAEWAYFLADSGAGVAIVDEAFASAVRLAVGDIPTRVVTTEELLQAALRPAMTRPSGPAQAGASLILYTSGTTGKPKGVVLSHANIEAQVRCLTTAWEWSAGDRILHVLPLNHVHGIINVLTCALWAGATCEMLPRFDADAVWSVIAARRATLVMAVPTIYAKLIAAWESAPRARQRAMSDGCRSIRLMVSGSAALPVRVLERWREISGHVLLERYGMTEIGMALSNPLHGERRPGSVGVPLPGVEVRIVDEHDEGVAPGVAGELQVRGPNVFQQYWQRPDATAAAFCAGWFRTGDVAVLEGGRYRLLGRQSVDIIKSGGYKISAVEIEEALREHPDITEVAVVGIQDAEWGERIGAAIVARGGRTIALEALREWARPRIAVYKLPTRMVTVTELPRNAMGKVSKPEVKTLFAGNAHHTR